MNGTQADRGGGRAEPAGHAGGGRGPAAETAAGSGSAEAFAEPRAVIDAYLAEVVATLAVPPNLRSAIDYALLGGGKRMRPLLAWHCCAAAAGGEGDTGQRSGNASLPAGAAVELVHAFSLVHDDLPAMDDDDLRRGRPTLHVHAGEAMAILAGDAMLAAAFDLLGSIDRDAETRCRLVTELGRGTTGMIAGQVLDTLGGFDEGEPEAERVGRIHRHKTGALIEAACRMGGLLGVAGRADGEARLRAIDGYARSIGLMFQVVDDLLDVEQSAEHTGKRTGKDSEAGKLTYPGVHGLERSRAIVGELLDEALGAIEPLGAAGGGRAGGTGAAVLRDLAGFMARRTK